MKKPSNILSLLKEVWKRQDRGFYQSLFYPAVGLLPLAYVFYAAFLDLPPLLNNITVFFALFLGLSIVLYWRQRPFIVVLLIGYIGLFLLPLTWLWRGLEFDDNVLMGIFPFNDGMFYLMDAYRLLMGLDHMMAPNVRPLFSGVLTFLMWMFGGNVQVSLAVFAIGTAISIFILALEIREFAGPIAAGMTTTILFYFYLPFLGRVHTENLGLNLGALALALLLKSVRKSDLISLILGSFALTLALNARAGAFTVLPILIFWAWLQRKVFGWKASFFVIVAIFLAFAINMYHVNKFGPEGVLAFSNYGHSLYGLAAGYKGYAYIATIHPEVRYTTNVFPYVWELILENPFMLLLGMFLSLKDYFTPNIMFHLLRFNDQQTLISWILYLITFLGMYRLIKQRKTLQNTLILYLWVGILLSVLVIPTNDGGTRGLMATNPVNALIVGFAFAPFESWQKKEYMNIRTSLPEGYAVLLGLVCALGPILVWKYPYPVPPLPALECPAGFEQISVIITPGSYINIVRNGPTYGFLPQVKQEDIRARLDQYHYDGNWPYILQEFPTLVYLLKHFRPGDTILIGINLVELNIGNGPDEFVFLITRTDQIQQVGGVNHFCARLSTAERLDGNRFYYEITFRPME